MRLGWGGSTANHIQSIVGQRPFSLKFSKSWAFLTQKGIHRTEENESQGKKTRDEVTTVGRDRVKSS